MLKRLHAEQNSFFILSEIQHGGYRSSITSQDCISFYVYYKSGQHTQHHYQSTFHSPFILHSSQLFGKFTENRDSVLGCKTAALEVFLPERYPL